MIILGIESSCDETSVALVKNGTEILSLCTRTQIKDHRAYGGVVPELASRKHLELIHPLIDLALKEAQITSKEIDALAVTQGPGLQGALLVGFTTAKTLAWLWQKPLIGVNHLEGHIYANFLAFGEQMRFPLLVLLVSGGHTQLIEMRGHGDYQIVGETRDDAMGEAFDKSARLLGLAYPGGPEIDKLAQTGNADAFDFPVALPHSPDFSFSGLKTSVLYTLRDLEAQGDPLPVSDLCASFQKAAIEAVLSKTLKYAQEHLIQQISITGGVSANSYLRQELASAGERMGLEVFMPPRHLCVDNAAMIAACAYYRPLKSGVEVKPRFPLAPQKIS